MSKQIRKFGWRKDSPSNDDKYHHFEIHENNKSMLDIDLRKLCPPVYDQGELGSCTANAIAAAFEFDAIKQNKEVYTPSRLFIYYNERKKNNNINEDAGASIRDSVIEISNFGVCPEVMWPYDINKFKDLPPEKCYYDALWNKCIEYKKVEQNLDQMKQCLAEGFPFVFGINVYDSFMSDEVAKTGLVPIPKSDENLQGGHALLMVAIYPKKKLFGFRNSWSSSWGDKGYGYIPFEYILDSNLASDFWTVRKITEIDDNDGLVV